MKLRTQTLKRQSTDSNKSVVGEPKTTTTVRAMNKNQTLFEIKAAIAAMLDSNWSYFSAPSYMKGFFADGIIRCQLYDDFLWPHFDMLVCNAHIWAFFVRIDMRVCTIMFIYLGIYSPQSRKERKYTWEKTACISCHNFETNGRPYLTGHQRSSMILGTITLLP